MFSYSLASSLRRMSIPLLFATNKLKYHSAHLSMFWCAPVPLTVYMCSMPSAPNEPHISPTCYYCNLLEWTPAPFKNYSRETNAMKNCIISHGFRREIFCPSTDFLFVQDSKTSCTNRIQFTDPTYSFLFMNTKRNSWSSLSFLSNETPYPSPPALSGVILLSLSTLNQPATLIGTKTEISSYQLRVFQNHIKFCCLITASFKAALPWA